MKTLVTGATGFIGTHLVKALVEKRRDVRCLVRKTSNTKKIETWDIELFYGDLLDKQSLEEAVKGIDIIYHLAGEVFASQRERYYQVNLDGLNNLLAACLKNSVRKIIHFSSNSSVGPNPDRKIPVNEDTPCRPIVPYGKSKLEGEYAIKHFSKEYGLPTVIIRPPVVYGPGVSQSSRVLTFLNLINKGLFRVVGDGENLISLCYIDNLIHGVLLAEAEKRSEGETYFFADERPYSINEIAETIAREEGKTLPKNHLPTWVAEILSIGLMVPSKIFGFTSPLSRETIKHLKYSWFVDMSKAQKDLGYKPIVNFNDGIRVTVNWFKNDYLPGVQ
jgi:nucleoside-diphosphate-sugar epimerase